VDWLRERGKKKVPIQKNKKKDSVKYDRSQRRRHEGQKDRVGEYRNCRAKSEKVEKKH